MTTINLPKEGAIIIALDVYKYVTVERLIDGENHDIAVRCGIGKHCRVSGTIRTDAPIRFSSGKVSFDYYCDTEYEDRVYLSKKTVEDINENLKMCAL